MNSDGPVQPISAAAGDPRKSLLAPFDGVVLRLLSIQTAQQARRGQPLLLVRASGQEHVLTAPADGLIVYIPAEPGMPFRQGDGLVWLL